MLVMKPTLQRQSCGEMSVPVTSVFASLKWEVEVGNVYEQLSNESEQHFASKLHVGSRQPAEATSVVVVVDVVVVVANLQSPWVQNGGVLIKFLTPLFTL